jgi:hypothetical protein
MEGGLIKRKQDKDIEEWKRKLLIGEREKND